MTSHILSRKLLTLSLILLPLNGLPYFGQLGEIAVEGAFYPLIFLVVIYLINCILSLKVNIPKNITVYVVAAFFFVAMVVSIGNASHIVDAVNKGRSGIEKFFFQLAVLGFGYFVIFSTYTIFRSNKGFEQFRAGILWSLPIPLTIGLIEIISINFNSASVSNFLHFIDIVIRSGIEDGITLPRVRGASGEPSFFGMYVLIVLPWLVTEYLNKKKLLVKFGLILLLMMTFYSGSRTALAGAVIEIIILYVLYEPEKITSRLIFSFFAFSTIGGYLYFADMLASLSLTNTEDNLSNIARYASQVAAIEIGATHPFGVGLGQFGFYAKDFYPPFSIISNEVDSWASNTIGSPWPPVHSIYARIFSEIGGLGLLIWLSLWLIVLNKIWKNIKISKRYSEKLALEYLALFTSLLGALLAGANSDSFRFMPYWILLALAWATWNVDVKIDINK